jgi:energy-coupling factor transport system permease protein
MIRTHKHQIRKNDNPLIRTDDEKVAIMKSVRLSALTKILAPLLMSVCVLALPELRLWLFLFIFSWLYLCLQGYLRVAALYFLFYGTVAALIYLIQVFELSGLTASVFYFFILLRMSPIIITIHFLLLTPPGEIIAVLAKFRLPRRFSLMVAVIFRYAPTVMSEVRSIIQAMRMRGLFSFRQCLFHPLSSFVYVLMPLLFRAIEVADELSIAAIARGAECPGRKYSYHLVRLMVADYIFLIALATLAIVGSLLEHRP